MHRCSIGAQGRLTASQNVKVGPQQTFTNCAVRFGAGHQVLGQQARGQSTCIGVRSPTSKRQQKFNAMSRVGEETGKALPVVYLRLCLCPDTRREHQYDKAFLKLSVSLSYTTSHSPSPIHSIHSLQGEQGQRFQKENVLLPQPFFVPSATV